MFTLHSRGTATEGYYLPMATVKELLTEAERRFRALPTARLEAEILLMKAAGVSRAWLFAHPEESVEVGALKAFRALVERRVRGEPVAYITGEREFWSMPISVSPAVLIPRPETEMLVEAALARIPANTPSRVADLGTGSGAIALAIASARPACTIHATDRSPEALDVARENVERLGIDTICFHEGSWFEPLDGRFDVIVSNPPYVAAGDPHLAAGDLRFEPERALVAGPEGLEAIRAIVAAAPEWLRPGGWLLLEHGPTQTGSCRALFETQGFEAIETIQDLERSDRVTLGRSRPAPPR